MNLKGLRRRLALMIFAARPFLINLNRGTPGMMSSKPPPMANSTPIAVKLTSQPHPAQPLVHDYIDKMLLRELCTAQVEAEDNEAFLEKLFPDDCLPEPLETTFIALSTGDTPILKLDGNPDHTWLFANQGITTYDDPETDEEQVASFMSHIAEAAYGTYKTKPKIYREWSGRFSTVALSTEAMDIDRKPDVIGITNLLALNLALTFDPPRLNWKFVEFVLEYKSKYQTPALFLDNVLKDLLNKGFCVLHSQDDRRFVIIVTLCATTMRFTVCDRGGIIHSSEFDIHRQPKLLLRLVLGLTFADGIFLGRDPTIRLDKKGDRFITVRGKSYKIIKTIWRSPMISGRATKCFLCEHRGKTYVIKDSWVVATRTPSEIFFLNEAAAAKVKNIPKLVDYEDVEIDDIIDSTEVNRGRFANLSCRIHRRLVFEGAADPIWTFEDKIELISAFINYLESHRDLLDDAHILHRDISLCNLMLMMVYTYSEDGEIISAIRKGILVDLDYANDEDEERANGTKEPMSPRNNIRVSSRLRADPEEANMDRGHRTGTPPFMANQILRLPDTKHTAVHDLESFFYVLLYICTMILGPNCGQKVDELPHFIHTWMYEKDLRSIGLNKSAIIGLTLTDFTESVLCEVTPYFSDLIPCLQKLQRLFHDHEARTPTHEDFLIILRQTLDDLRRAGPADPAGSAGPAGPGPADPVGPVEATDSDDEEKAPLVMPLGQDVEIPDLIDDKAAKRRTELRKLNKVGKASLVVSADPFLEPHTVSEASYVLGAARPARKHIGEPMGADEEDEITGSAQDKPTQENSGLVKPQRRAIGSENAKTSSTSPPSPPPSPPPSIDVTQQSDNGGEAEANLAKKGVPSPPPSPPPHGSLIDVAASSKGKGKSSQASSNADPEMITLQNKISNLKVDDESAPEHKAHPKPRTRTRGATNPKTSSTAQDNFQEIRSTKSVVPGVEVKSGTRASSRVRAPSQSTRVPSNSSMAPSKSRAPSRSRALSKTVATENSAGGDALDAQGNTMTAEDEDEPADTSVARKGRSASKSRLIRSTKSKLPPNENSASIVTVPEANVPEESVMGDTDNNAKKSGAASTTRERPYRPRAAKSGGN